MTMRVRPGKFLMRNAMRGVYTPNSITPKAAFLTNGWDPYGSVDLPGGWAVPGGFSYPYGTTLRPFGPSDHVYFALVDGGTTSGTEPIWPDDGTSIADGTQIWQDLGTFPPFDWQEYGDIEFAITDLTWQAGFTYSVGDVLRAVPGAGQVVCTVGGLSGGSEPTWDITAGNSTIDNAVTWITLGTTPGNPGAWRVDAQGDYPLLGRDVSNLSFECTTSADWFMKSQTIAMGTNLTMASVKYLVVYQPGLVVDDYGANRINPVYFVADLDDAQSNIVLASDTPSVKFADPIESSCASSDDVPFQIQFYSGF